jgi:predicted GIY-YIG superfamily endonuclease
MGSLEKTKSLLRRIAEHANGRDALYLKELAELVAEIAEALEDKDNDPPTVL